MERLNLKIRQLWATCKGFLAKRWPWAVAVLFLVLVLLALIYGGYWVYGTGFGGYYDAKGEWQRWKTLWDWLDLLLVPVLLALGAWLLNRAAREREHKTELDRSRDPALQLYISRVSALPRDTWHESGEHFIEANITRAQTVAVLRQLDGRRNDPAIPIPA